MGQWAKCNLQHNISNSCRDLLVGGSRHSSSHLRHSPHLTKVRCWTLWLLLIRRRPLYKRWLVRIPQVTSVGPTGSSSNNNNIHSTGNNSLPIDLRPNTLRLHSNNSLLRMACLLVDRHSKRLVQEQHNSARPIEADTQLPRLKCCRLRCSTPSRYVTNVFVR